VQFAYGAFFGSNMLETVIDSLLEMRESPDISVVSKTILPRLLILGRGTF